MISFRCLFISSVFFCVASFLQAQEIPISSQDVFQKKVYIAGVEPSVSDLIENFYENREEQHIRDVYSAFELQDFWLEDLKNETGPILLIAKEGNVRLMRLERKNTIKPYH